MSKFARVLAVIVLVASRTSQAQSTAAYRAQLDSLVRLWRPLAAAEQRLAGDRRTDLPPLAIGIGNVAVRADSVRLEIARRAAERLAPLVERAYGASASRLSAYTFVVLEAGNSVIAAIADSSGRVVLRGGILPTVDALFQAWESRASEMMFQRLDPELRQWMGGAIPLEPLTRGDFADTRIHLLLEGSKATRDCANGNEARCAGALGLSPTENRLFTTYDATEREAIVKSFVSILRRADPAKYDRCTTHHASACDSLAELVPPDAVPLAAPPRVRQDFVRYALALGGDGAFDRFLSPGTPRQRIERAARMPADSVVARWQANFSDARSTSTAIDTTTAISSLVWAAACAALALRSSRWR